MQIYFVDNIVNMLRLLYRRSAQFTRLSSLIYADHIVLHMGVSHKWGGGFCDKTPTRTCGALFNFFHCVMSHHHHRVHPRPPCGTAARPLQPAGGGTALVSQAVLVADRGWHGAGRL